jgi:hypothetical protein
MSKQTRKFGTRWFRVYDEAADDPKLQMLSDKLHRCLFVCWCLASKHGGYLPPIAEIAWKLRKSEAATAAMIAELHDRGLLDEEGTTFQPHNWPARQFQSDVSTERVRAHRERQRNVSETPMKPFHGVAETPPEAKAETETETEQKQNNLAPFPCASDFPKTDAAVRRRCPTADLRMVTRITEAAVQAYLSVDDPKMPPPDDAAIAEAVEQAAKDSRNQQGPALFLKTVPAVMKSWAELGRHPPARAHAGSLAERTIALMQKRIDEGRPPL